MQTNMLISVKSWIEANKQLQFRVAIISEVMDFSEANKQLQSGLIISEVMDFSEDFYLQTNNYNSGLQLSVKSWISVKNDTVFSSEKKSICKQTITIQGCNYQ